VGDPTVLSSGFVLNPPSPVLLQVSGTEDREFFLFNKNNVTDPKWCHLPVLLHERATLYHEPLSDLFDALREELKRFPIPSLDEGEMMILTLSYRR
jgi:hypothetical protein